MTTAPVVGAATGALGWSVVAANVLALGPVGLRWLRVAQREHYLPGAGLTFAARWWSGGPVNLALWAAMALGAGLSARWPAAGFATAAVAVVGPLGLGLRGRTSPLAWTRRLRTLAAVWAALELIVGVGAGIPAGLSPALAAIAVVVAPALVDLACALTAPFERRAGARYVRRAAERLARVRPRVVAITGSYGKTTTKAYVAHLLAGAGLSVVASPASFNNRAGLARGVNEHLADGTDVFVAEMGTYGPGEIAELCVWLTPEVSVITAIGPVHLERFGSEDRIIAAKSEILEGARVAVLNVDDARLAALASSRAQGGQAVVRCSGSDLGADVAVLGGDRHTAYAGGRQVADDVAAPARPTNVACALGVVVALGLDMAAAARRLSTLPSVAHRLEPATGATGALVLDDTYNANPSGAAAALETLVALAPAGGRRVVVTPGMVELGPRQADENARFAAAAAVVATDLVIVGRTNRRALERGASTAATAATAAAAANGAGAAAGRVAACTSARTRDDAVAWVRANLGPGDIVLYENDLPDHYA